MGLQQIKAVYEYAGFDYILTLDDDGRAAWAKPVDGQHIAAGKDKHRRAAVEMYNQEKGL
jgi:hypothetical protein